jgi:predicted AlkP superfamily pyrophosphatase or phosphodiesterase
VTQPRAERKVLLIGWDAADWEVITPMLEEGLLPTLDGLINRGVMGNLATLQPILSPMLWNSVATGKFADKHGIHGFIEPDPVNGGARPYTSTSRKCKALWNILTESGLRSNVVGWWASHPAEPINGTVVTNAFAAVKYDPEHGWQIPNGAIHPPEKAQPLTRLKVFASELTAAHILPFIPDAAKVDQQVDRHLESFAKVLSDAATIHAVATALMEQEPWDFTAVYYDAIDHFSHAFMAYHPPRLEWVAPEQFELYKEVVRGAYRFHDMMLERLLQLAGPETTVLLCSDHGFESGAQRPRATPREPAGPAIWHRPFRHLRDRWSRHQERRAHLRRELDRYRANRARAVRSADRRRHGWPAVARSLRNRAGTQNHPDMGEHRRRSRDAPAGQADRFGSGAGVNAAIRRARLHRGPDSRQGEAGGSGGGRSEI